MKAEYKTAVERFPGKCHQVSWENPFEFEVHVPAQLPKYQPTRWIPRVQQKASLKATFEIVNRQYFSLPKTIMAYLLQNQTSQGWHKLHKCCKYFFTIYPHPVCHKLCSIRRCQNYSIPIDFYGQSLAINFEPEKQYSFDHKVIVSNAFSINEIR